MRLTPETHCRRQVPSPESGSLASTYALWHMRMNTGIMNEMKFKFYQVNREMRDEKKIAMVWKDSRR